MKVKVVEAMTCADCGELRVVMLTQTVTIGKRVVEWVVCSRCWIRWSRD